MRASTARVIEFPRKAEAIPVFFNLRQQRLSMVRTHLGIYKIVTLWTYYSFLNRHTGTVIAPSRKVAKKRILEIHPEATFYR